jgi:hypothetical protein
MYVEIIRHRTDEGTELTSAARSQLNEMLENHIDLFEEATSPTQYAEHRIETGDHSPIANAPYRLSPIRKKQLEEEIPKMLESGIIEECDSPWAAPVVMVPKPGGEVRVCIDYRQLNAITKHDHYPLPRIDDLLHAAKQTKCMSTLDLRSGYWQIGVRKEDRDKTAFITPFGMYRFLRMSFGLRNAPATFQRLIDRVKNGLPHLHLLAYLDDLILLSPTFEDHVKGLGDLFKKLRSYTLKINRPKCNFCFRRTEAKPRKDSGHPEDPRTTKRKTRPDIFTNVLLVSSIYTPVCRCRQTTHQINQEGCCLDLGKTTTRSLSTIETLTYDSTIVTASRRNKTFRN